MKEEKKQKIYDDYVNGDDKKAFFNFSKLEMLEFIEFFARYESRHIIINRMRLILERGK